MSDDDEDALYKRHHLRMLDQHPGSITPAQYKAFVLTTADADGRLYPPPLGDGFARYSLLMGMVIKDKTIDIRSRPDQPMQFYINDTGRKALVA